MPLVKKGIMGMIREDVMLQATLQPLWVEALNCRACRAARSAAEMADDALPAAFDRRASPRARVEITHEALIQCVRVCKTEVSHFAIQGTSEDAVERNVAFLTAIASRTCRLSVKDLQRAVKEELGIADPMSAAWCKCAPQMLS